MNHFANLRLSILLGTKLVMIGVVMPSLSVAGTYSIESVTLAGSNTTDFSYSVINTNDIEWKLANTAAYFQGGLLGNFSVNTGWIYLNLTNIYRIRYDAIDANDVPGSVGIQYQTRSQAGACAWMSGGPVADGSLGKGSAWIQLGLPDLNSRFADMTTLLTRIRPNLYTIFGQAYDGTFNLSMPWLDNLLNQPWHYNQDVGITGTSWTKDTELSYHIYVTQGRTMSFLLRANFAGASSGNGGWFIGVSGKVNQRITFIGSQRMNPDYYTP